MVLVYVYSLRQIKVTVKQRVKGMKIKVHLHYFCAIGTIEFLIMYLITLIFLNVSHLILSTHAEL